MFIPHAIIFVVYLRTNTGNRLPDSLHHRLTYSPQSVPDNSRISPKKDKPVLFV